MERKLPRIGQCFQRDGSGYPSPCPGHARLLGKACGPPGSSRISALLRRPAPRCWSEPIFGSPAVDFGLGQLSKGSAHAHILVGYLDNSIARRGTYDD